VVAAKTGRTKPTRATQSQDKKRKKNDGRPPDTIKELVKPEEGSKMKKTTQQLSNTTKKLVKAKAGSKKNLGPASYRWKENSCWLDTSLELTFVTVMDHFPEFAICCQSLPAGSGLRAVFESFKMRSLMKSSDPKSPATLGNQRDELRTMLKERKLIDDLDGAQPLFVRFWKLRVLYPN
jgi:hypothetical protein